VILLSLANLFEQQDQIEPARDLFLQVLQIVPESLEAIERLRAMAVREQDWQDAIIRQEMKEVRHPDETDSPQDSNWKIGIRFEVARQQAEAGEFRTAQALLKYIFRITDFFVPAWLLQGEILEKEQPGAGGLRSWEEGFRKTQNPVLVKQIAESFLVRNLPDRAIEFIRDVIREHPDDPRLSFCLGDLYGKLEMPGEAVRVFDGIRQRHPDWMLNNIVLADLHRTSGHLEKAADLYRKIAGSPECSSFHPWQCYNCNTTYIEYMGFCRNCLAWNTFNLNQNKAGSLDFGYEKSTALPL